MRERFMKLNSILFIGGRIHQQDQHAQDIVYDLLEILENNPHLQKQIVPIHNFNILEAPLLFQGADASIMLADDTREASATGFMKAQMNGSAILATSDGAVPEFVQFGSNGFLIPYINGEPTAAGLLEALETFDQAMHDSKKRMSIVRAALAVTNQVDVHRTVVELQDLYQTVVNTPTPVAAEK
jgi:glucan phosphorylase